MKGENRKRWWEHVVDGFDVIDFAGAVGQLLAESFGALLHFLLELLSCW